MHVRCIRHAWYARACCQLTFDLGCAQRAVLRICLHAWSSYNVRARHPRRHLRTYVMRAKAGSVPYAYTRPRHVMGYNALTDVSGMA